jgi:prophage DNA circulation protein
MDRTSLEECTTLIEDIAPIILGSIIAPDPNTGAALRRDVGLMLATAATQINNGAITTSLLTCFEDARIAGADLIHMSDARDKIVALSAVSEAAIRLQDLAIIYALSEEAQIIVSMTFNARDDVETLIANMNAEFNDAEEESADRIDSGVYQALVALHASVTRFLVTTAQPLPAIVEYQYGTSFPSLVLAYKLFQDAGRADEVAKQNHVIHPAFMPWSGRALSA